MKNKIILSTLFLIAVLVNMHVFTDVFGDTAIPKVKLYGTSTYWADSTNYQTTNKSIYTHDSLKVGKWLYAGVNGEGGIYLDTGNSGQIFFTGNDLAINNVKPVGNIDINSANMLNLNSDSTFFVTDRVSITNNSSFTYLFDENGISGLDETQQIKIPSDTASDYDANDAITLNRQSGILTTKSLTTATDNFYTFTLTNSLITTTSKVFLSYCGGTESAGRPTVYRVVSNSGSATIIILNLTGAGSFNGNVKLNFVVFN